MASGDSFALSCQVGVLRCKDSYVLDLEVQRCILVYANTEVKVQLSCQPAAGDATIAHIQNFAGGSKGRVLASNQTVVLAVV